MAVTIAKEWLCSGWTHRAGNASVELWCLSSMSFECVTHGGGWIMVWSCSLGALALGLLGGARSATISALMGPSGIRAIWMWLLLVLGLEVFRRGHAAKQDRLPLVPLMQEVWRIPWMLAWEILGKAKAWAKTDHLYVKSTGNGLDGWQAGCRKVSGNHQGGANCVTRLMKTQIWHLPAWLWGGWA